MGPHHEEGGFVKRHLAAIAAIACLTLASCETLLVDAMLSRHDPSFSKKNLGGPETHVLVFGSLQSKGLLGMQHLEGVRYIQLNPRMKPEFPPTYRSESMFFFAPQPVGGIYKLYTWQESGSQQITSYYLGVQGQNVCDFRTTSPGLFFAGSSRLEVTLGDSSGPKLVRGDEPTERKLLEALLKKFKGTAWEPVIQKRIAELPQ
jgi:hypothetical protein